MNAHLSSACGFELNDAPLQHCRLRCHYFDKSRPCRFAARSLICASRPSYAFCSADWGGGTNSSLEAYEAQLLMAAGDVSRVRAAPMWRRVNG